jgi:hypothetical protein
MGAHAGSFLHSARAPVHVGMVLLVSWSSMHGAHSGAGGFGGEAHAVDAHPSLHVFVPGPAQMHAAVRAS